MSELSREERLCVARRLRTLRKRAGLTQMQLAERMGQKPALVSQFECGYRLPGFNNIIRLADALGCSTDAIVLVTPTQPSCGGDGVGPVDNK